MAQCLSKQINHNKTIGVTLARFLWAGPMAGLYLITLYYFFPTELPKPDRAFGQFVLGSAVMQILATSQMVKLFQHNNYAVGAGLVKSEAMIAAIFGMLFFGTTLSTLGWLGVIIGTMAVLLLATKGQIGQLSLTTVVIGLGSGSTFALTSLWARKASLHLQLPFPHGAAWVLFAVITTQTIVLSTYLIIFDRKTLFSTLVQPQIGLRITIKNRCLP